MKNSKAILLAICASVFAVLTVVNMSLASPKSAGENTLDMLEIMTRAFDESEGGEGGSGRCFSMETTRSLCNEDGDGMCRVYYYFEDGSFFAQHTYYQSENAVHHVVCVRKEIIITP